jgi:hypothetical protein
VQHVAGEHETAHSSLVEAQELYRQLEDKVGQAYVLNALGARMLESGCHPDALARHREALCLAREAANPLEEARALEGIGRCGLGALDAGDGRTHLRQALAIYKRLGVPELAQVIAALEGTGAR